MKGPRIKADTLRELFVSSLFSTCIFGLVTQIAFITNDFSSLEEEGLISKEKGDNADSNASAPFVHPVYRPLDSAREPIHIGMIMKNVGNSGQKPQKLKRQFVTMLTSLLGRAEARTRNINLVLLTDPDSVGPLLRLLQNHLRAREVRPGDVTFDFFDVNAIAARFSQPLSKLRPLFTSTSTQASKYRDDLFLVAPFYHRVFPFRKFVMLDVDLKFRVDIEELFAFYEDFEEGSVMSVANDLAPHYYHALRFHRQDHPETDAGLPGRKQGFNTGVVLFDLDRMRGSELFNKYVDNKEDEVLALAEKYRFRSHLGDQCFFSLLGQEYPELFHALPCQFNYQLDVSMSQKEFRDVFNLFHNCSGEPKIFHGNGGTPIPEEEDEFFWEERGGES